MSGSVLDLWELRQHSADETEMLQTALDQRQLQIHTATPAQIVSYNPSTMTATVQPALRIIQRQTDGTQVPRVIQAIQDVPVGFPGGGGYLLTFPVQPGDECLLVFCERQIDNWHQHGGIQTPTDFRLHDISDAVALVGLRSQPNRLAGASGSTVQLRSDAGNLVIELDGSAGNVNITGNLHVTGAVIAGYGGGDQVTLQQHKHTQPPDGRGDTEQPTNPPTAGT
jgi:hypothetical protein